MNMATTPTLLSIDEYLRTDYHPDADYVDGEIEERNLGEYEHAKLQHFIDVLFGNNEDDWGTDTVVEQRIRVNSSRVRVCDVAILRAEDPHEHVTATPPLICIEIMSPEDRIPRATRVLADYFSMGVPNIWLVDPIRRVAYIYGAGGLQPAASLVLTIPGTPIRLDLNDIFLKLDRKIAAHKRL
jgi:Uma2 family endonuclease